MQNRRLAAFTAVGLAAAIAVPTIAFGNARRNEATGSLHFLKSEQTPYVARLTGAAEVAPGDTDGVGGAAVTFEITDPASNVDGATVCWDLSYSGLTGTPTGAHIHRGAAGSNGNVVIPFGNLTATGATGCAPILGPQTGETVGGGLLATEIVANPAAFYINVHTTDFVAPLGAIRGQLSAGPAPAGEAHLLPTPLRVYDSRSGAKILPGETRTISLTTGHTLTAPTVNEIALPPGATAAIITLTIAETNAPGGFLTIYSEASAQPATSSINWKAADQDIAVGTQVAVNAKGEVKVTDGINTAPTHFIIDVVGYYY